MSSDNKDLLDREKEHTSANDPEPKCSLTLYPRRILLLSVQSDQSSLPDSAATGAFCEHPASQHTCFMSGLPGFLRSFADLVSMQIDSYKLPFAQRLIHYRTHHGHDI